MSIVSNEIEINVTHNIDDVSFEMEDLTLEFHKNIATKIDNGAPEEGGMRARHTCQPVRLAGTCPAQSPSHHDHKKDAAYLSFSSSLGTLKAKSKATSKASMHVHQDIKSRYHKAGIT